MISIALAKLAALTAAGKVGVGVATAASVVAVGGATGVLPVLPEAADKPASVEQADQRDAATTDAEKAAEAQEKAAEAQEEAAEKAAEAAQEAAETDAAEPAGTPAPQASFGQGVATDARDGGVDGPAVAESARAKPRPTQAPDRSTEGTEQREQAPAGGASTGEESAEQGQEQGAESRDAGQQKGAESSEAGRDRAPSGESDDDESDQ